MPYIVKELRNRLDPDIDKLLESLYKTVPITEYDRNKVQAGHLNYCISKIVWSIFENDKNYDCANKLIGVLEAVKLEVYRRQVAIYEDTKIIQSGDLMIEKK